MHVLPLKIDLSLSVFPWAAHRADTANVKLSVGLNHSTQIPEFVALSEGQENDMVQGRQFTFPKGSIACVCSPQCQRGMDDSKDHTGDSTEFI